MEVEIKLAPLQALPDINEGDKASIILIATAMSTLHLPNVDAKGWTVTKIQGAFDIVVPYPLETFFSLEHLLAVRQMNPLMIKSVWVQNDDSTTISLCCKLGSRESDVTFRLTEVTLQAKYEQQGRKRKHPESSSIKFISKKQRTS